MLQALKSTGARAVAAAVISTAGALSFGIAPASAQPPSTTPISGVTLENMWMHCNAFGGYYDEGPGWAYCILPSGQVVWCNTTGCTISAYVPPPKPIVPRPPIGPIAALGG